jgi:hypothetical protein
MMEDTGYKKQLFGAGGAEPMPLVRAQAFACIALAFVCAQLLFESEGLQP